MGPGKRAEPASADDRNPSPDGRGTTPDSVPHAILDVVSAILRALAETARPESDARDQLEAWARHILVLAPAPGSRAPTAAERDWPGLGRYVVAHVRDERAAVSSSISELRDAVWLVIERLSHAIVGDAAADAAAKGQLDRLRAAVERPVDELKATALETVDQLSEILQEKHSRQRQLARELGERVEILNIELEDTKREAEIDPLTQLWNRGVFQRELPRAVQVRTLLDEPACLLLVDIDQFKLVNDTHGHKTGDSALESLASVLARSFPRRSDTVTRLGGDEFAVILPSTSVADAVRLGDRLLAAVRQVTVAGADEPFGFTVSLGLAEALQGERADGWFARADKALYDAKAAGRDRLAIAAFEPANLEVSKPAISARTGHAD